jgi:hypothetical protein
MHTTPGIRRPSVLTRVVAFVLFLSGAGIPVWAGAASPSDGGSARQQEARAYQDAYGQFMTLLEAPRTLAPESLRQADIGGNRIALYRVGDPRNHRFPAELYEAVENRMLDRILAGGAFQVFECMQCKTVKVTIRDGRFSMARRAETNARLREIADDIGVDGMLLWDAYYQYDRVVLDARMMEAETGRIVWSKKYTYSTKWDRGYSLYTGLWGLELTRFATATEEKVSVDRLVSYGAEFIEPTSFATNLKYGLGLVHFENTAKTSQYSFNGDALYAKIQTGLDPLFMEVGPQDYANFNWYLALGDAYIEKTHNLLARTGLEVRFSQLMFMRFGGVYLEDRKLDLPEFEPTGGDSDAEAEFGGISYEVLLGVRF